MIGGRGKAADAVGLQPLAAGRLQIAAGFVQIESCELFNLQSQLEC